MLVVGLTTPVLVSFAFSSCNDIVLVFEGKWKVVGIPLKFSLHYDGFDSLLSATVREPNL
jgi:hypothetical protein